MNKKLGLGIIVLMAVAIAIIVQASAEKEKIANDAGAEAVLAPGRYSYAAKFVCGDAIATTDPNIVVSGKYLTAINIHNPYRTNITLYKKVVRALPEDVAPLPPSNPIPYQVKSDYAFEIDCQDIRKLGGGWPNEPFVKGFVVLYSPKLIDVVGVYTSTSAIQPQSITLDVERVEPINITG